MPWNLLLLPLLGGYLFIHRTYLYTFRSQRLDGYRLLLDSALAGVVLAAIAWFLTRLIAAFPAGAALGVWWKALLPFDFSGAAAGALLLGFGAPYLVNWKYPEQLAKEKAFKEIGDDLLQLVYGALRTGRPVLLSLDDRKVYVGLILAAPDLERLDRVHIRLLPIRSGYRHSEDLGIEFTVRYDRAYLEGDLEPTDFAIVIPASRIATARLFDLEAYQLFQQPVEEQPRPAPPAEDVQ